MKSPHLVAIATLLSASSPFAEAQISPAATLNLDSKNAPTAPKIADISGNVDKPLTRECPDAQRVATADAEPVEPEPRPLTVDASMDEAGKLDVVARADGVVNKDGSQELDAGGSVKSVGSEPMVEGKASASGTVDGEPARGGGSVSFGVQVDEGLVQGTARGTGVVAGEKSTVKPAPVDVAVTPEEESQIKSDWTFDVNIERTLDAKGAEVVLASATLQLPNGDRTAFAARKVKYNTRKGYVIPFGLGTKIDAEGNPLLDPKGKPLKDKKSRMTLKSLVFTEAGENWEVSGGEVEFRFLGQKGTWGVQDFLN